MVGERIETYATQTCRNGSYLNRVATGIHDRRAILEKIEAGLRELNQRFPGQRSLPYFNKDIEYRTLREELLGQKRLLVEEQTGSKKAVRGRQRFFEQRKQR